MIFFWGGQVWGRGGAGGGEEASKISQFTCVRVYMGLFLFLLLSVRSAFVVLLLHHQHAGFLWYVGCVDLASCVYVGGLFRRATKH